MSKVLMKTNFGELVIELYSEKAPKTVENFLSYVNSDHYSGTIFHRVINGFMVQGGGFEPGMQQKETQAPVENEANNGVANEPYTLAMARTNMPHSATCQFFINVANNSFLNFTSESPSGWGYCVFGKVIEGQEIVDKIKSVETANRMGYADVPVDDIVIESAEVVND